MTDGRAPSFYDLSMGEALAPRQSRGEQRRGQVSLADKSLKKTSPGVSEPEKRFHSPVNEYAIYGYMLQIAHSLTGRSYAKSYKNRRCLLALDANP